MSDPGDPPTAGLRWLPAGRDGRLGVLVAIVAGVVLRVVGLDGLPLWLDEHSTAWAAAGEGYLDVARRALAIESQAPLAYLAARLSVDVVGPGSLGLRLPSLVAGIATLFLVFPLGRRVLRSDGAAAIAVGVAAVYEPWILASQEARPYGLAILFGVASTLAFLRLLDGEESTGLRAAWLVLSLAALYTQYLTATFVAVQGAIWLGTRGRAALADRWTIAGFAGFAVAATPAALALGRVAAATGRHDWLEGLPWSAQTGGVVAVFAPVELALLALFLLLAGGPPDGWSTVPARRDWLAIWALVPVGLFVAVRLGPGAQLLFPRYLFAITPAAILLLAWLAALAPPSRRGWAIAVVVAAALVFELLPNLERVGAFAARTRDGWTEASRAYRDRAAAGEPALYCSELVEANAIAREPYDAVLASHLAWPLLSELAPERQRVVKVLPRELRPQTEGYVRELVASLATAPRAWMIGSDRCLGQVGPPFFASGLEVRHVTRFGAQVLLELGRRPAPPEPPPAG